MKIYTGIGDAGNTNILGENGISKADIRVEAYGSIDELNSQIGWLSTFPKMDSYVSELRRIQNLLFSIGSVLASTPEALSKLKMYRIKNSDIRDLENSIDKQTQALPDLKAFVLPGSCKENAACHVARTVCRRAERSVVREHHIHPIQSEILIYLNRLSDYLFTLSRTMTAFNGVDEIEWKS